MKILIRCKKFSNFLLGPLWKFSPRRRFGIQLLKTRNFPFFLRLFWFFFIWIHGPNWNRIRIHITGNTARTYRHTICWLFFYFIYASSWQYKYVLNITQTKGYSKADTIPASASAMIHKTPSSLNISLKVHKIEIFFCFDFEICIISLLVMSKY